MDTTNTLSGTADIKQTVETRVETVVKELTYTSARLVAVSGGVRPDGVIGASATLLPVADDGTTGKPVIVGVADLTALAAKHPEVTTLLQSLKALVFAVAREQGKI